MKPGVTFKIIIPLIMFSLFIRGAGHAGLNTTQSFDLNPGWNVVFLDVQPDNTRPAEVFSALPDDSSVWCWLERNSRVEYIQNPGEGLWNQPGWIAYFNSASKQFLTNLHAVLADQAYLIFLGGGSPITLTVTGTPSVKKIKWVPDSFNLVGFSLADSEDAVSFGAFFSHSKAHAGQAFYRLSGNGTWELISNPSAQYLKAGEAYWIYCSGASDFQGPLDLALPSMDGLDYSYGIQGHKLVLKNLSDESRQVEFSLQSSQIVMAYRTYDEASGRFSWPDINTLGTVSLDAEEEFVIKLCVRREAMAPGPVEGILEIADNAGINIKVPVRVDQELETQENEIQAATVQSVGMLPGLWVGTAGLDKVSQANQRGADFYFDLRITGIKNKVALIKSSDVWACLTGAQPDSSWKENAFNDETWARATETPDQVTGTAYFRKTFTLPLPSNASERQFTDLFFTLKADDGAAVYLNGKLIHIYNLESLDHDGTALTQISGDPEEQEVTVPVTWLNSGENLVAVEIHQSTGEPEDLVFGLEVSAAVVDTIIPLGSGQWDVYDQGNAPADDDASASWKDTGYVLGSQWESKTGPFAYDENENSSALNMDSRAVYFRTAFTIADASAYDEFYAGILYDDGAVLHVNGTEDPATHRLNMPGEGDIDYDTCPVSVRRASEEGTCVDIRLNNLVSGINVLAAEVHQHPGESAGGNADESLAVATNAPLDLRLLLHVDADQNIRLLKEVIIMRETGDNGGMVLLTDHEKIPEYSGVAARDGEMVGRRISAVGMDFLDDDESNPGTRRMTGQNNSLSCELVLPRLYPTNPFLHQYHPDHDNLDSRYKAYSDDGAFQEVPEIIRQIQMNIATGGDGEDPASIPPGWGRTLLEGEYTEVISGLHKTDITVKGDFTLNRVSDVDLLNP